MIYFLNFQMMYCYWQIEWLFLVIIVSIKLIEKRFNELGIIYMGFFFLKFQIVGNKYINNVEVFIYLDFNFLI